MDDKVGVKCCEAEEGSALYDLQSLMITRRDGTAVYAAPWGAGDDFIVKHWKEVHAALASKTDTSPASAVNVQIASQSDTQPQVTEGEIVEIAAGMPAEADCYTFASALLQQFEIRRK